MTHKFHLINFILIHHFSYQSIENRGLAFEAVQFITELIEIPVDVKLAYQ